MDLSLNEASTLLGRSVRQLRYQLQKGEIKGSKQGGQWRIPKAALKQSQGQEKALKHKRDRALAVAEEVLKPQERKAYSVTDLRAFEMARALYQRARKSLNENHPVPPLILDAMIHLSCGCHAYQPRQKAEHFIQARENICRATVLVFVDELGQDELAQTMEQELLPAIGGLIRRVELKRK